MSKSTFLKGALILTVAGIIVKIIGSVNRILLSRLLGGEGVGLYQMAYPIYLLSLSISSAGIPIAISIIVAEKVALGDFNGASRVFKISLGVLAITGIAFTLLLYFGAGWLIEHQFVRDSRAYYAIVALAPAIFFATIISAYRGYFQGLQIMTPTAVSQIFEQLFRVCVMVALAYILLDYGLEYAAAGASFGATPGAIAAFLVLIYFYWRHKPGFNEQIRAQSSFIKQESAPSIIKRMIKLALPVSLANIMVPIVSSIDLLIVPARLEVAGFTVQQSTELFGYLTGMALPLITMATILTGSLAASLVPAISEAFTLGEKNMIYQRVYTAMRITNVITIPSAVGLFVLATPISQMLYGTPNAGTCIAILAAGVFLLGLQQVTTGILQGLGKTMIPVINLVVAAGSKIAVNWYLIAMPVFGIKGAAWATIADFGVAAILNIYFVNKYTGFLFNWSSFFKAVISSFFMGIVTLYAYNFINENVLSNTIATLVAITFGAATFFFVLTLVGGIEARDIERIPKIGTPLAKLLLSLKLLRR